MKMINRMVLMRNSIHKINKLIGFQENGAFIVCKRCPQCQLRPYSTIKDEKKSKVPDEDDEVNDRPITYSTSAAAEWSSRQTFGERPKDKQPPKLQSPAVVLSLFVFLVYFCILREESDIDEKFVFSYEQVEGLEEVNVRQAIHHRKNLGLDTQELEAKLEEIIKLK